MTIIEEFTTSRYYKENLKSKIDKIGLGEGNLLILEEANNQLQEDINSNYDIILIDRTINDRQIWNYRRYLSGDINEEKYFNTKDKYSKISKELTDFLLLTYANPIISLKRDYLCNLSLEKRNFLNQKNIEEYNNCLNDLQGLFSESVDSMLLLDTSDISLTDVSIEAASQILPVMRKKYIKEFEQKYNLIQK